jgi:hypothetical protein
MLGEIKVKNYRGPTSIILVLLSWDGRGIQGGAAYLSKSDFDRLMRGLSASGGLVCLRRAWTVSLFAQKLRLTAV